MELKKVDRRAIFAAALFIIVLGLMVVYAWPDY